MTKFMDGMDVKCVCVCVCVFKMLLLFAICEIKICIFNVLLNLLYGN